jgi:hypothetical protein
MSEVDIAADICLRFTLLEATLRSPAEATRHDAQRVSSTLVERVRASGRY